LSIIAPLGCAGAGWIVARFHKRDMVLIFVMTVLAWDLKDLIGIMYTLRQRSLPEGFLIAIVLHFVVEPVSILVGGALTARMEAIE
jgi:hypothetical protein